MWYVCDVSVEEYLPVREDYSLGLSCLRGSSSKKGVDRYSGVKPPLCSLIIHIFLRDLFQFTDNRR
jgi:hypothetical protein